MAVYELKGDALSIRVDGNGAELKSLTENATGQEYMWDADAEYWPRTSPVLFPFVGRLKEQKYVYNGKTYEKIPQHGFARDEEFTLTEQTEDSLRFCLRDSDKTRECFPFSFCLEIAYRLAGKKLFVSFLVRNEGQEEMFFSLGAHPGFVCPKNTGEKRSDYYIGFDVDEKLISRNIDMSTGLAKDQYTEYKLEQGLLPVADDLFKNDALVLENNQVHRVSLLTPDKKPYLTLQMDAPVYGIWSSVKPGAPFICIEPWFGRCDALSFEGELQDREYQNCLQAGAQFHAEYAVTIE